MSWNIVIRKPSGIYVRVNQFVKPDEDDLSYLELFHAEEYKDSVIHAVVVNVFEVLE